MDISFGEPFIAISNTQNCGYSIVEFPGMNLPFLNRRLSHQVHFQVNRSQGHFQIPELMNFDLA